MPYDFNDQNVPKEAWELVDSALKDEQSGELFDAAEKYKKAIEIHPTYEGAWINLTKVFRDLKLTALAEETAKKGLEHLPNSSTLWTALGNSIVRWVGHPWESRVEDAFRKALECDPANLTAALNLSSILTKQGKIVESEIFLTEYCENPKESEIEYKPKEKLQSILWAQLALFRAQLGKITECLTACEKSRSIDQNPQNFMLIGKAYAYIGDIESAKKYLKIDSTFWFDLGHYHKNKGNLKLAMEFFEMALSLDSSRDDIRISLSSVLSKLEMHSESLAVLKPAIDANSDNYLVWFNYGLAQSYVKNNQEAIRAVRKSLELKEDNAYAWFNLGVIYDEERNPQETEAAYRKVIEIDPEYYDAWSNLGVLFVETGRYEEAEAAYRRAINQTKNVKPWGNLANLLGGLGRYEEAWKILNQAKRIAPDDPLIAQVEFNLRQVNPR